MDQPMLEAGAGAPDFTLPDQDGKPFSPAEYGKKHWGVQRATFLIDPDGRIAEVFPRVSPKSHDDIVLEALAELS